jgi:hypothetical protein
MRKSWVHISFDSLLIYQLMFLQGINLVHNLPDKQHKNKKPDILNFSDFSSAIRLSRLKCGVSCAFQAVYAVEYISSSRRIFIYSITYKIFSFTTAVVLLPIYIGRVCPARSIVCCHIWVVCARKGPLLIKCQKVHWKKALPDWKAATGLEIYYVYFVSSLFMCPSTSKGIFAPWPFFGILTDFQAKTPRGNYLDMY